jgi:hypothetical protein
MSSVTPPDLQDRVQTITDAFVAFDESRAEPAFALDTEDATAQAVETKRGHVYVTRR